jgi:hypothetical protein
VKREAKICGYGKGELLKLTEPRVLASDGRRFLIVLAIDEAELQAATAGLALAARALRVGSFLTPPAPPEPERPAARRGAKRRSTRRR